MSKYIYYGEINLEMKLQKITQKEMSELIGISQYRFSRLMRGQLPWTLEECYAVLEVLNIPKKFIFEYFPPKRKELTLCSTS